jgi:alpha-mannosidase
LPPSHSFVVVDQPNVDVEAVKPAEDTDDTTIVRLRETIGRATECRAKVAAAAAVQLNFRAWEIKTLAVEHRNGEWYVCETDLLERPLDAET